MKRLISILLALTLCLALIFCVQAADNDLLVDDADLLTDAQEKTLIKKLAKISSEQDFDVVIATTDALTHSDILEHAEDFYEDGNYADDGIIFVCLAGQTPRYGYVVFGDGNDIFDDSAMDDLDAAFRPSFYSGNFNGAFTAFAEKAEQIVADYSPISVGTILISIIIGAVLALLIPMATLKGQLKSVRMQAQASSYVRRNSMVLTQDRDLFLYRNITRTAKPKNNSSSGGTRTTSGGNRGRSG